MPSTPHAKEKVQNLLDLAMNNSLSGLRLVWTCGFWFKKDEGGIEDLGTDFVLVQGMLAKLRNAATSKLENKKHCVDGWWQAR